MLLYRTQPKTPSENNLYNLSNKIDVIDTISSDLKTFKGSPLESEEWTTLITDASIIDALLVDAGYNNILVVTSFEDALYDRIRDRNYRPVKSAGDHLLPVIHKLNESSGNIYVTKTPHENNWFTQLYNNNEVNFVESETIFRVDGELRLNTNIKFDAVVLLGSESLKQGKFNAKDVKKKFEKYCTDKFDLIDIYRNNRREIKGSTKSIDKHVNRFIVSVNTPAKVYDNVTRINLKNFEEYNVGKKQVSPHDRKKALVSHKQKLLYYRLALNIEHINEYYRVF